jgi:type IV pilus assembly protein PilZ
MSEPTRRDSESPPAPLADPVASANANGNANGGASSNGSARDSLTPPAPDGRDRRSYERFEVTWSVDCKTDETFLYASIRNISEMGIFIRTTDPLPVGTQLTLRFAPPDSSEPFVLRGAVQWVNLWRATSDNPNPGMGIYFTDLNAADRERIVDTIRTIAYLRDNPRFEN